MATRQNSNYGYDIQKLYLEMMLSDAETFVRCQSIWDPTLFDRRLQSSAKFLKDYVDEFNTIPTVEIIQASTGMDFDIPQDLQVQHYDWLLTDFETFIRHKGLERAISESMDLLEKGDYGPVEEKIKNAIQVGLQKDMGTDYWLDPRGRLKKIKDRNGQISTGWRDLDNLLFGGMSRGELNIFAGGCVTGDTMVEIIRVSKESQTEAAPQTVTMRSLSTVPADSYLVLSADGYVPVLSWRDKGTKPCVRVHTATRSVVASTDHLFEMSTGRWKYAGFIVVGEKIRTVSGDETVIDITPMGAQTVYDFHIDHENHRYYTNGFSSHNSGAGKSLFLANLAVNFVMSGLNVIYLTHELSEELVSMRIDSMVTGIASRDIFKQIDDVEAKVRVTSKRAGSLQVKYMPSGKTANDIRSYLKEYQIKTGKKPDVLLDDYLDLLMPMGKKISAENLFIKDKYVSEELRNLAVEQNCILVTAAQLNRCLTLDTRVEINGDPRPISDVKVGDQLSSNNGSVTVEEVLPIIRQPVYEIKLKSGKTIKCSGKHLFQTPDGLRNIENGLQPGDKLYTRVVDTQGQAGKTNIA